MKPIHQRIVVSGLAFSLAVIGATSVFSTVVPLRNLAQLADLADLIFVGTVLSVTDHYVAGQIPYTEITFKISKSIKGELQQGDTFRYRQAGLLAPRELGNGAQIAFQLQGFPQYRVGEESLTFLHKPSAHTGLTSPVGLLQGKFTIVGDAITNGVNNQDLFTNLNIAPALLSEQEASLLAKNRGPVNAKAFIELVSRAVKEHLFR